MRGAECVGSLEREKKVADWVGAESSTRDLTKLDHRSPWMFASSVLVHGTTAFNRRAAAPIPLLYQCDGNFALQDFVGLSELI